MLHPHKSLSPVFLEPLTQYVTIRLKYSIIFPKSNMWLVACREKVSFSLYY